MTKEIQSRDSGVSRRGFITTAGAVATVGALTGVGAKTASAAPKVSPVAGGDDRTEEAFDIRVAAAETQRDFTNTLDAQEANNDEALYADQNYYASFTKTLPHNEIGEVEPSAFDALVAAATSGNPADYDAVPLDPTADRALANPQGANRFVFAGLDGHATRMRPAPAFNSAETAAEIAEVYWLGLTRDVPFQDYRTDPLIKDVINDLNSFSVTMGPFNRVTTRSLFRGETKGDIQGPYVSQFLYKDIPYGPTTIVQKYVEPIQGVDFMIDNANWLNVQRGGSPQEELNLEDGLRYIYNNRTLGEYVHTDVLFQAYFNALLIGLSFGPNAIDVGNPYTNGAITNQGGFTSLGGPWFIDLLTQAGNLGLNSAWYHKWDVHRRLRPEAMAGRIHHHLVGNATYDLNQEILDSSVLPALFDRNGTYFLPMAFTEGSPTHPSYPAGHATVAGACCTVLKAIFDEDFVIPDPVEATADGLNLDPFNGRPLTMGGEINKLASNISLGRDAAGVHYRSDGVDGNLVGEQQAIALLQDYSIALNEEFGGFNLTKFDGTRIQIVDGQIL